MRITQGTFSFLPDLTDEQLDAQVRYAVGQRWALSVEHTDDPHPRNPYWEMWGQPMFDLEVDESEVVLREVRQCREAFPRQYVKLIAYDASRGRQTTRLSFIVGRPPSEPGFGIDRTESHDRVIRYGLHAYATDHPPGQRYRAGGAADNGSPGIAARTLPGEAADAARRPVEERRLNEEA
jgi:ribulose-bisphosphate carboxylase small chain